MEWLEREKEIQNENGMDIFSQDKSCRDGLTRYKRKK